ncbi:MAG: hypothetical protein HYZ92_02085 [Candidatus Omnitrophica bacterium]|nr:hypothetical protein [Candidatus Omnitrophota bacterium]
MMTLRTSKRVWYALGTFVALAVAIRVLIPPKTTVKQVEDIVRLTLPVGSDVSEIVAFLKKQKMECVNFYELSGVPAVYGTVRNANRGLLFQSNIQVVFDLDDQGKLTSYRVEKYAASPELPRATMIIPERMLVRFFWLPEVKA